MEERFKMIYEFCCSKCGKKISYDLPEYFGGANSELFANAVCDDCEKISAAEEERNRRRQLAAASFQRRWTESNLDRAYMGFDEKHPEANIALFNSVKSVYLHSSIFLSGDSGIGKTRIVQHFARRLMSSEEVTAYYSTWVDLCDEIAACAKSERGKLAALAASLL